MIRSSMFLLFVASALAAPGCSRPPAEDHASAHAHGDAGDGGERGPHRGRLLEDGDFALELQIVENGVPPEFHIYTYRAGKPLPPDAATVTVALTRLDNQVDRFTFTPREDYLLGSATVHEPHSFSVVVEATESGRTHRWTFDSFEGRTTIATATAQGAGVRTAVAGPAVIEDSLSLTGRIVPNAERVRAVTARFPGPIRQVFKSTGDTVRSGEPLAIVESDDSLQSYTITAPLAGIVIERHANPGEKAGDEPLFVVADYGALWAELTLFPRDLPRVRNGMGVVLHAVDAEAETKGTLVRIAPAEGATHGSLSGVYTARVALDNRDGQWTPGMFVRADVRVGEAPVPLAVRRSGLQAFRDSTVVFEQIGETYEVRMLKLGRQDATHVEVLDGLKAGARYVAENSYLIKADIEKSGASHDH